MSRWRLAVTLVLAFLVALPLVWPAPGAVDPAAWPGLTTLARLLALGRTTLVLVALTLSLALPAGVVLALLLERTDLPGRRLAALLLLATLFVPLPLFTSAWQVVLARLHELWNPPSEWSPWLHGLLLAAWIHAAAGLPWVVLLTAYGLRGVERDLEEDAMMMMSPAGVIRRVSLPRSSVMIAAAALWVALQTAGEITVTDLMQVRTIAEEVYTQFVAPEVGAAGDPRSRAVAASFGQVILTVGLILLLAQHAERWVPRGGVQLRPAVVVPLGRWRWPLAMVVGALLLALTAVPLAGLLWRAGLIGAPPEWSLPSLLGQMIRTTRADGVRVVQTTAVAVLSGCLCAALALVACWLARESRWFRVLLLVLLAVAWSMPGPVIGLGLKGVIGFLLDATHSHLLRFLLWDGPSYLPLVWVYQIRFLPFAAAFLWPVVRLLPNPMFEAARLDGAGPRQELLGLVAPMVWPAWWRTALAAAILSLGELSAGKMVSTPGAQSYSELIWAEMHYGVTPNLAAQCLLLLVVVLTGVLVLGAAVRFQEVRYERANP
jgi:iron(III) transport system permease protein